MLSYYLLLLETDDDQAKFEQLYQTYKGLLFYVANQILHNEQDAEDCVHQAFLAIIENLDKISEVRCPKTRAYVVIIVERKALDWLRKNRREWAADMEGTFYGVEIPLPGDGGLADAMASLPANYRELLLLRYDNGYSSREMAKMLGMTHDAVRKQLWRAKQMLQGRLETEDK